MRHARTPARAAVAARHFGRRVEPPRARSARAQPAAHVGGRRDLQLQALWLRSLLLHAEGRAGPGGLRDVPRSCAVARLAASGRRAGGGPGAAHALRGARQVPAQRRGHAPRRAGRALRGVRAPQVEAGAGRPVRPGAQAPFASLPARSRRGDLPAGGRAARRPDDAQATHAGAAGDPLSHAGAGGGRRASASPLRFRWRARGGNATC